MSASNGRPSLASLYREARYALRLQARVIARKDAEIEDLRARLLVASGRANGGPLYSDRDSEIDEIQLEEWRKAGVIH